MDKIKKNYLYSIGEITRERLLIDVKSNSFITIRKAIKEGQLKAFKSVKKLNSEKGKTVYLISGEDLEKYIKLRKKELSKTPITSVQRNYIRNKKNKQKIIYLHEYGYPDATIAKELGLSRQYIGEVLSSRKELWEV